MSNYAYLLINRDMGNDYTDAQPYCPFWKNLVFNHILKPLADKNLTMKQGNKNCPDSVILSDVCSWYKYYILKYDCPDTKRANSPFANGRNYRFKMYIILEGKPSVLPVFRFEKFINE